MTSETFIHSHDPRAHVDQAAGNGTQHWHAESHALEGDGAPTVRSLSRASSRRIVSGPPPPGGPMALLDAYHDLLREAVRYASERGFFRSWDGDGVPQVKVYVGPRDERGRPEGLLVLRAQAAFDFAWRMYDWAMGQKRAAERARDGSGTTTLWRAEARRRASIGRAAPTPLT